MLFANCWCHLTAARAAERRNSKRRRQQKKAQQEWQAQTQREQMWYQVTAPPPQPLLDSAPDFFNDQQQQQGYQSSLSLQGYWDPDNAAFGKEVQAYSGAEDPMQQPATMQSPAGPPGLHAQPQHKMAGNPRNRIKQQQVSSQPWPVSGPDASADVLWVEHRRSQQEQQQYRSQQQQQRRQAATPQRRRPAMAGTRLQSVRCDICSYAQQLCQCSATLCS